MASKIGKIVATLLLFAIVAIIVIYASFRASLPQLSGEYTVSGLDQQITIKRDDNGVAHIFADNEHDLYFGLGFAHAQDRLWQLEMNRRTAHGELAEILGEEALPIDRYFRTLGFTEAAEKALANMPGDGLMALESYARGVNAYLDQNPVLPPEFLIMGVEPRPWKEIDSLVWMKMLWLDLSGNYRFELARARLMQKVGPERVAEFFPSYEGEDHGPLPNIADMLKDLPVDQMAQGYGALPEPGYGSNNWVVSGDMTRSGMPLLANDPHLRLSTPSIWYLAHMHLNPENRHTIGVTAPGIPSIILGHNDSIAWGFTNTATDVQDLFIEKLVDENTYLTPDGPAKFITREEVIKVKGTDPVTITVRSTRHGPVLSDLGGSQWDFAGEGYVLALQWTALADVDTGAAAAYRMGRAMDYDEFRAAGMAYQGPEQNMVYADTAGNIGYNSPALVPVRHPDNEIKGRIPSPGWLARYDWQGFVPADEMPSWQNPEKGYTATANEKIIPDDYPHFLTSDWSPPYRSDRIHQLLEELQPHDADTFRQIHGDTRSNMAMTLLPLMLAATSDIPSDMRTAMEAWDYRMQIDSAEAMIFAAWRRHFARALYSDELGDLFGSFHRPRPRFATGVLSDPESGAWWCDDKKTTDITETCDAILGSSLKAAIDELTASQGPDWKQWAWGRAHILRQEHRPLSNVPRLADWFETTSPQQGSNYTVNVAGVSFRDDSAYTSGFGASYRAIYDLGNLEASTFVLPTGQSGHFMSPWYQDQLGPWNSVEGFTIPHWSKDEPVANTLVLLPDGSH